MPTQTATNLATALELDLSNAVETFIALDLADKAPATRRWYAHRLHDLAEMLGNRPLVTVLEVDLLAWKAQLIRRDTLYQGKTTRPAEAGNLSPQTVSGYVRAARRFFRWLFEHDFLPDNPARSLKPPRKGRIGEKGISDADAGKMLAAAYDSPRDYAILYFVSDTGCRLGGVTHLALGDLFLDHPKPEMRRVALVREKGDKTRPVVMTEGGLAALNRWLEVRPADSGFDAVFLGRCPGTPWHPLQEAGIYGIFKRYALASGASSGAWSPHQWRHRFGRRMAANGMNLGTLSQLMGHSTSSVTVEHYGMFSVSHLQEAYDRFWQK